MKSVSLPFVLAFAVVASVSSFAASDPATGAPSSGSYPLTTCIVSGDKLGEMGPAVRYVYQQPGKPDRVLEFCCEDCIADFQKDPAKYVAKLDAASVAKSDSTAASAESAAARPVAMTGCCAAGTQACCELVQNYLPISAALAADDLPRAKTAATALVKQAEIDGMKTIADPARAVADAADISAARDAFKTLSAAVEPLVEGAKGYQVMHCPMANADWVQTDASVRNPYFGQAMLTCGAPKK